MFNDTQINLLDAVNKCKLETAQNIVADMTSNIGYKEVRRINSKLVSESDIEAIQNRSRVIAEYAKSILADYGDMAKTVNPIGLTLPLLSEKCDKSESCGERKAAKEKAVSEKTKAALSQYIDKSIDIKDAKVTERCTKKESCKIDKTKVAEAVECLSELPDNIDSIIQKAAAARDDIFSKTTLMNSKIETSNFEDITDILNLEAGKIDILEECFHKYNNVVLEYNSLENKFRNAATIVMCAAKYNPRAIRESTELTIIRESQIDSLIYLALESAGIETDPEEEQIQEGMDEIKSKTTLSNQKFLKKYQDAAMKSSCSGISVKKWYTVKDVEKVYKDCVSEAEKTFKVDYKTDDELKRAYKQLKGSLVLLNQDSAANAITSKQLGNSNIAKTLNLACNEVGPHTITKDDVRTAIGFLKTCTKEIDKLQDQLADNALSVTYNNSNPITIGRTKNEKYTAKIEGMKNSTMKALRLNYTKIKLMQLKTIQKQSRLVILKAARTNISEADVKELRAFEETIDEIANILN